MIMYIYFYIANSFIGLVRYLFKIPEIKIFFSRTLCQDPLENFFGCQRQVGGTNDNPTVQDFQKNTQALHVVNSFCRPVVKGNCRGNTEVVIDKENSGCPLPRSK